MEKGEELLELEEAYEQCPCQTNKQTKIARYVRRGVGYSAATFPWCTL